MASFLGYLNFQTDIQGTASSFSGHWETNYVDDPSGFGHTHTISVVWEFNRN